MGKPKRKLSAYNLYMRRALKGKLTGKTKAQRKAIFKAAAKGWKKGKPTPRSSKPTRRASPKKRSNPTGGTRTMTKNSFNMNKIYGLIRKVAVFLPAISIAISPESNTTKLWRAQKAYFGYDSDTRTFSWSDLWQGWAPAIGAQVITRVVPAISKFIRSFF